MNSRKKEKSNAELSRMFNKITKLSDKEFAHMMMLDSLISDKNDKETLQKSDKVMAEFIADMEAHFPGLLSCFSIHNDD